MATNAPVANLLSHLATNPALALPSPLATNLSPGYFSIANSLVICGGSKSILKFIKRYDLFYFSNMGQLTR